MAENERDDTIHEIPKSDRQETESSTFKSTERSPGPFSPVRNLVRRLSLNKSRENEEPETTDNDTVNNTKSTHPERKGKIITRRTLLFALL